MALSAARKAAFKILLAVERRQGHSDDLLRADAVNKLAPADRNLTTNLVLGTLRWQAILDGQIRSRLAKPNARLDTEIAVALRLGAFQLLYLDRIPAHAAIDESVELAKRAGHKFAAGMVNAVLRGIADSLDKRKPSGGDASTEATRIRIESRAAYPAWMVERWVRRFGADQVYALCAYGQQPPTQSVRLIDRDAEQQLAAAGVELAPGTLLSAARTVVSGDVTATEAFSSGRVRIQDEGSQLVAEIAACAAAHASSRVLDACAAPGGKTLILAERFAGAKIVAFEVSPARFASLRDRLAAYSDHIECRMQDAAALSEENVFDLVLVDAPCSGTGTLGRNPEIRHQLKAEDLARQAVRQKAILLAALRAVTPTGRVVYSTCSLEPEENEQVVAAPGAQIVPISECLSTMRQRGLLTEFAAQELSKYITPEGALRLIPGMLHTDGFYVAILQKSQAGPSAATD